MVRRKTRRVRRGLGLTEWVLIAAVIGLAVVAAVTAMGTRVQGELGVTAQEVADPASLTERFGPVSN